MNPIALRPKTCTVCGEQIDSPTSGTQKAHTGECSRVLKIRVKSASYHRRSQGKVKRQHHLRGTPEYKNWSAMKARCDHKPTYQGVQVCERWRESFNAFLEDMGPKPGPGYSLDRIDNSKGYEPGNVRWATASQQQNNKTNNLRVEYGGRLMTLPELEALLGISRHTLRSRVLRGSPIDAPLAHAFQGKRRVA